MQARAVALPFWAVGFSTSILLFGAAICSLLNRNALDFPLNLNLCKELASLHCRFA